jgi:N-acetylneuraminic acid mutarotase
MPGSRADASSAVIDRKLYVFGGYGPRGGSDVRQETLIYEPASETWQRGADMPGNNSYAACACAIGRRAYVFGGLDPELFGRKTLHVYDAPSDRWVLRAPFPVHASIHSAAAIAYNGKIYVIGGARDADTSGSVTVYDPATDTYDTSFKAMPTPRRFFSLSEVNGVLYAIGGGGPLGRNLATNEAYDVEKDSWSPKVPMPYSRWGLARENAAMPDGRIIVSHGLEKLARDNFFATNAAYYPSTDKWESLPPAVHVRDGHNCGVIDGKFYAVGGRDGYGPVPYNEQFAIAGR